MKHLQFDEHDPWSRPPSKKKGAKDLKNGGGSRDDRSQRDQRPSDLLRQILNIFDTLLGGGNKKPSGSKRGGAYLVSMILLGLVAVWGVMGFYLVDEQERGVVLRFGKYITVIGPGLKWQPYFIDKVVVLNVTRVRSFSSRGIMLTKDENIVDITVNVQYLIDNPQDFVIKTRDPELSLRQATDSSLRHVVGGTIMDRVITEGRAEVALSVQERIQLYLNNYGTGIRVNQVSIQRADPPEQVKASFEDVISAREDKVRFINQATAYSNGIIPQARGEARRITEEGKGYKQDKISRASGQAQRFDLLYKEYLAAPAITRKRLYLEAMEEVLANSNKILIDVSKGNNLLYLPLDRLLTSAAAGAGLSGEVPGSSARSERGGTTTNDRQVSDIVRKVMEEVNKKLTRESGR